MSVQVLVWPIGFLSSAFVSPDTMPAWLGAIATWNPLSATATAIRGPAVSYPERSTRRPALSQTGPYLHVDPQFRPGGASAIPSRACAAFLIAVISLIRTGPLAAG